MYTYILGFNNWMYDSQDIRGETWQKCAKTSRSDVIGVAPNGRV